MNLTKTALSHNRVTIIILLVILIYGLMGYNQLSRNAMPPFTIRVCSIVTQFPGASPERVEELITDKIEQVVQELPELKNVTSESRTGLSVVSVELAAEISKKELQPVWDKLRRKIESIAGQLPSGIIGPDVKDEGIGVVYGIMLGLTGDGFSFYELKQYAEDIRDEMVKLDAAAEVEISGLQPEQIYVEFDNARLAYIGLNASQLQGIIAATNIVFSGGEVSLEDERIVLEPTGNFESLEDLKHTLIPAGDGSALELGNIATVRRDYKRPIDNLVKINGKPGLAISVALKEGANIIELGQVVDDKITDYNATLPLGLQLTRMAAQDYYVDSSVKGFVSNVIQSVVIVLAVMLLFLGLRTGLVVASLIPMAIVMTLMIMNLLEVGLNQVTLAALIMALGMLVDNAIVVSESIMVKMEEGIPGRQAAIDSSKELMIPLLISSLTTSAAFLAFFLAENTMGEMMGPLFVVITIALLSSWVLAMTMVTMLGVYFIKVKQRKEDQRGEAKNSIFHRLHVYYKEVLLWSLKRPLFFLMIILGLLVGSLLLFPTLPFIFFPDSDRNLVTVNLNLPLGTKIERTEEIVKLIEKYVDDNLLVGDKSEQGIIDYASFIGQGPKSYDLGYQPGEANSGYAHILLNTSSFEANNMVIYQLDSFTFENIPDAEIRVSSLAGGGGGGSDIEVRISGNNPADLFAIADEIKQKMNQIEGSKNIKDSWGPKIKKFILDIDQEKANRANLTNQDIALTMQTTLSGSNAGSFRDGEDNIPIIMRNENSLEIDVRDLNGINISSQSSGKNVPLIQVAEIKPEWQYAKILRRNLYRTLSISCDAKAGTTAAEVNTELSAWLKEYAKSWKSGYTYTLGGESEQSAEAMGAVASKLPLAGFIILLLLMLQFNSFRKTFIVISTIPLGIIGVILGLVLFGSYFGFMSFLGIISLAGIIINNAIVLIDRINIEETEFEREPFEAIIEAAKQRFRPILLTTFTTALGLIPLYLGGGLMWEPMAISIMIGLLFATIVTLLFVPVLYKLLFRIEFQEVKI